MERSLEVGVTGAKQWHDDLEGLLEAADSPILGQPERMTLTPGVAGAQAEHEPPVADLVERLDGLREYAGVVVKR